MKKNNLDEMQEQKLLQIEHTCCWIAFWGLLAVAIVQLLYAESLTVAAGELSVLFLLCGYLTIQCLRNGLWDRTLKPDGKTNFLCSLLAAVILALFCYFRFRGALADPSRLFLVCLIPAVIVFALCFLTLTVCTAIVKKRRNTLDNE